MAGPLARLGYGASQGARVAWFMGHYLALRRMHGPLNPPGEEPATKKGSRPGWQDLIAAMRELFERDWANIEAGIYLPPADLPADPASAFERSMAFFRDARAVDERRLARRHSEVMTPERKRRFPRYYLQNFHYQTDGWLSDKSARLYDTQVEVLFTGTADVMRRQALVPLARALQGRDQRSFHLLDVACGTGRFLGMVAEDYPRLNITGIDLSPPYIAEARTRLARRRNVALLEANAERLPADDASQDVVSCVYLYHELPPKIRKVVAGEMARVLKPGGTLILVDALQTGDRSGFDGLLEFFPIGFHEPYFNSYLKEDLARLFAAAGLEYAGTSPAFLSKVMWFTKPA